MYSDDLPRRERCQILAEQQGHRCCYCGVRFSDQMPADIRLYHDPRPSVEHVVRIADGGKRTWTNEVAACRGCNSARGETPPNVFYELASQNDASVLRHALRASLSAKRRSRQTLRHLGPSHVSVKRVGKKWPPLIGELMMTPERQAYFDAVYGPWQSSRTALPEIKKAEPPPPKPDKRTVVIGEAIALRWDVRQIHGVL